MITSKNYIKRIKKLQKNISVKQAILLSRESDIKYFSNFHFLLAEEREAFILVSRKSATLIYTSFSPVKKTDHLNYLTGTAPLQLRDNIKEVIRNEELTEIIIDPTTLYVSEAEAIKEITKIQVTHIDKNTLQDQYMIKDTQEIELVKKSCLISQKTYLAAKSRITLGMTELEIKQLIEDEFRAQGITELAFPTIVAFGENAAKPHHQPSNKQLENDMVILIDMGSKFQGYCADMTRTFWFGDNPSKKFLEIQKIVKDAYTKSFETLKKKSVNLKAKDLDNAARVLIMNQGYGESFIHTTGHSLGLSIHEQPSISWRNQTPIKTGMTITIEPGIYLEGELGYRYENTILVTKDSAIELTNQ